MRDCYLGDPCQFHIRGVGITLDDILRDNIQPNITFARQSSIIRTTAALTSIMLALGLADSALSFVTFHSQEARKVGCGTYLLASSIVSLFIICIFTAKFWFLITTQMNASISRTVLRGGCVTIDPLLKLFLYMDSWLSACVAVERAVTVVQGVNFDKSKSKRLAQVVVAVLPFLTMGTLIHEPLHRELFGNSTKQSSWCVTRYSSSTQTYDTAISFVHFLAPFFANVVSALVIIFGAAHRRAATHVAHTYMQHVRDQLVEHKQLVVSPVILVVLSLPRLIISVLSGCVRASDHPWLYLWCYVVSFVPSILGSVVFILPSKMYQDQLKKSVRKWRRRLHRT